MIRKSIKRAVVTVTLVAGVAGGAVATMQPLPTHAAAHTNSIGHWADPGGCLGTACGRPMHVTINSIGHWADPGACQGSQCSIGRTRNLRPLPPGRQPV
jgi:hypothetical protein